MHCALQGRNVTYRLLGASSALTGIDVNFLKDRTPLLGTLSSRNIPFSRRFSLLQQHKINSKDGWTEPCVWTRCNNTRQHTASTDLKHSVPSAVRWHPSAGLGRPASARVRTVKRGTASYDRRRREQVQRRSERAHASELTTTLSVASSGAGLVRRPARISERAAGAGTSSEWEGDLFDSQFQAWI